MHDLYHCGNSQDDSSSLPQKDFNLPDEPVPNSSGSGLTAALPPELNGFNWGACLGSIPWALAHRCWGIAAAEILLVRLSPPGAVFMFALVSVAFGFTGNDLAWKYVRWRDIDHFQRIQRRWASIMIGLTALASWVVLVLVLWDTALFRRV